MMMHVKYNYLTGRILWLSGSPGMGKSTSAQILGRKHGYVYYEGDCFGMVKNPFIDLNVAEPTMHQIKQKNLKGMINASIESFR